jgi:ribonuclease P protein component
MERLRRRADFRAASSGARTSAGGFALQARQRAEAGPARIGFTVSKQVGNAVERNRVRRRLREIVRLTAHGVMREGHDYVLIGRRAALTLPFGALRRDFDVALDRIHGRELTARREAGARTGAVPAASLHETGSPPAKPRRQHRDA